MKSGSQGGNGNSFSNGPVNIYAKNQRLQGPSIAPVSCWDFMEGELPE